MLAMAMLAAARIAGAQDAVSNTFQVTGTVVPKDLVKLNFGRLPRGIRAFDLNICNQGTTRQSLVSSEVLQALARLNPGLQPIGRQILLAAILRNQNRSVSSVVGLVLNSAAGVLSVLAATHSGVTPGALGGMMLGSVAAQQLLTGLRPVLTADQVEKFESLTLEPALVLDGGSCVERTVFALGGERTGAVAPLQFHVR
jgi:hypothetical protein